MFTPLGQFDVIVILPLTLFSFVDISISNLVIINIVIISSIILFIYYNIEYNQVNLVPK
jgi:hypothetical protein